MFASRKFTHSRIRRIFLTRGWSIPSLTHLSKPGHSREINYAYCFYSRKLFCNLCFSPIFLMVNMGGFISFQLSLTSLNCFKSPYNFLYFSFFHSYTSFSHLFFQFLDCCQQYEYSEELFLIFFLQYRTPILFFILLNHGMPLCQWCNTIWPQF